MAKIEAKAVITASITLSLTESEAKALSALAGYGAEVEGKVREFLDSPRGRIIADNLTVDEAFKKLLG